MRRRPSFLEIALLALALTTAARSAECATLDLSYSTTYNGTSVVTTPAPGTGFVNTSTAPDSLIYGHSFSVPTEAIPGTPSPGYGFYDDYIFTISGVLANSISTTINLAGMFQIDNFQERLYRLDGNATPTLGTPVGGAINAWTSPVGGSGTVAVLPTTMLDPGTYVLQMRGNVTGSAGGSYSGTLNIVPVPLPGSLPMMLIGAGVLARVARRKRTAG